MTISQALLIAAPWLTLANISVVFSALVFVGRKLTLFDRLVLDQARADKRASMHSAEIGSNDRRIVVLETLVELSKGLPEQVARLVALMERIEEERA